MEAPKTPILLLGFAAVLSCLVTVPVSAQSDAPQITAVAGPERAVQIMKLTTLWANVDGGGDPRDIEYHWSIESETYGIGSGSPVTNRHLAELTVGQLVKNEATVRFWWDESKSGANFNEAAAQALSPGEVVVRLEANFVGSAEVVEHLFHIQILGVNRPVIPQFCTSSNYTQSDPDHRVTGGQAGALSVNCSIDPDEGSITADWQRGAKSGPGNFDGIFVLYQSDTPTVHFTIPRILGGDIDQTINVTLYDGLFIRSAATTLYLAKSTAATSSLPQVSVETSKTVQAGHTFQIVATGSDSDGDSIQMGWTFLGGAATSALNWVNSPSSGSSMTSTLTFPGAAAGSLLRFEVSAWEAANTSRKTSKVVSVNVVSNPPPSGGTPSAQQVGTCAPDANGAPTLVAGQYGGLAANPGNVIQTWATLRDASSAKDIYGNTLTGPDVNSATWDYTQLQALGASSFATSPQDIPGDNTSLKFQLSFHAPATIAQQQTVSVFLTVADRKGCSTRVTFPITLYSGGGGQGNGPTASIRYDLGSGLQSRPANGTVANVTKRSIQLNGAGSDGAGLGYSWSVSPQSAGSLTSTVSQTPTLQVNSSYSGNVTVTLNVTDQYSDVDSQSITFQILAAAGSLEPGISYDIGSGYVEPVYVNQSGPTVTQSTIHLRGSLQESTDSPTYQWSISGMSGATLGSETGTETTVQIDGPAQGTLVVTLEVGNTLGDSGAIALTFPVNIVAPPEAEISAIPVSVRVGEAFFVDGSATSNGGTGKFNFSWTTDPNNEDVPTMWRTSASDSSNARIVAPTLGDLTDGVMTVTLSAEEEGGQIATDERQVILVPASLDFSQVAAGPFDAPQVCENCTIETVVVLVNPDPVGGTVAAQEGQAATPEAGPASCRMEFYEGPTESSVNPTIDGDGTVDAQGRYLFQIPKGEAREFSVQSDSLWIGWLSVESSQRLVGHLFYRYVDDQGHVTAEVPVLPIRGTSFTTALSKTAADKVGLAIANLSDNEVKFQVTVDDGVPVLTREISIPPRGQFVKNLTEVYDEFSPSLQFPPGFQGGTLKLKMTSGDGPLALTVIKLDAVSLPLAILPVSVGSSASQ